MSPVNSLLPFKKNASQDRPRPYCREVPPFGVAGADVVLGMIPFARELLRMGAEVVMCANSQPAINDITAPELRALLDQIAAVCPIIKVRVCALCRWELASRVAAYGAIVWPWAPPSNI